MLGICYGMQLLVHELGGKVEQAEVGEFGRSELHVHEPGVLLAGTAARADLLDVATATPCTRRPPGFTALASSTASPVAAFEDRSGASTASSSTPRSCTPRTASRS